MVPRPVAAPQVLDQVSSRHSQPSLNKPLVLTQGALQLSTHTLLVLQVLLVLLAVAGWLTFRKERHPGDFLTHSLVLAALTTVLFSPHYPWYFAWLLPLLVVVPDLSLLYLTLAAFVLYRVRTHETPDSLFSANTWLYLPFVVLVTARCIWHRFKWQIHRSVHW